MTNPVVSLRPAKIAFGYLYPDGFIEKFDNPGGNGWGSHVTVVQFKKEGKTFTYQNSLRKTLGRILGIEVSND